MNKVTKDQLQKDPNKENLLWQSLFLNRMDKVASNSFHTDIVSFGEFT